MIYIVLQGEMTVSVAGRGQIARLGSGEIVGEISFVDARPPSATVVALGDRFFVWNARWSSPGSRPTRPPLHGSITRDRDLLADRLRDTGARLDCREVERLSEADGIKGEFDDHALGTLHLAGGCFNRILELLLGRCLLTASTIVVAHPTGVTRQQHELRAATSTRCFSACQPGPAQTQGETSCT